MLTTAALYKSEGLSQPAFLSVAVVILLQAAPDNNIEKKDDASIDRIVSRKQLADYSPLALSFCS